MVRHGVAVVVSGPSGVGKSTLCRRIVDQVPRTALSVSCTTRRPRPGERDGMEYHFVSGKQFDDMVRAKAFLEWAEVYDHRYGTPVRPLAEATDRGVDMLLDIDTQGARQIMERSAGAVYVFVAPPSLDVLRTRLTLRASDAPEEIQRRFRHAREEMAVFHDYHYLIQNDRLDQAVQALTSVILAGRVSAGRLNTDWLVAGGLLDRVPPPAAPAFAEFITKELPS